jgi:hypothetical protein
MLYGRIPPLRNQSDSHPHTKFTLHVSSASSRKTPGKKRASNTRPSAPSAHHVPFVGSAYPLGARLAWPHIHRIGHAGPISSPMLPRLCNFFILIIVQTQTPTRVYTHLYKHTHAHLTHMSTSGRPSRRIES